jgi:hypothetical protein
LHDIGPEGTQPFAPAVEYYRDTDEHWLVTVVGDGNDDMLPLLIW